MSAACFALCGDPAVATVATTSRLLQAVPACQAHLGDLTGNVVKAALRADAQAKVTLIVTPLAAS